MKYIARFDMIRLWAALHEVLKKPVNAVVELREMVDIFQFLTLQHDEMIIDISCTYINP